MLHLHTRGYLNSAKSGAKMKFLDVKTALSEGFLETEEERTKRRAKSMIDMFCKAMKSECDQDVAAPDVVLTGQLFGSDRGEA